MKRNNFKPVALSLCLIASCLLSGCDSTKVEDLIVPTYNSEKKINIGAWSWSVGGLSATQLKGIEDAGMNIMIGTFNGNNNDSADASMLNNAKDYDIGFVLDKRNWDGTIPSYAKNNNFLGYCTFDEPNMADLKPIQTMKQNWDKSELKDKMFYVNLNPSYSPNVADYEEYIRSYTEDVGLDMVSTDFYPLYEDDSSNCGVGLREDWLCDLSISAYYAKKNNVPLWFTLLTTKHQASNMTYINPDARDLEYQMYVAMAFGTQYLIHYTYAATGADHINPIVDTKGKFTDSYFDVQASSETIRKWDKFYMDFEWVGATGVYGKNSLNSLIDYLYYEAPLGKTGALKQASSSQDVIIGQFVDKQDNKGFLVTNLSNPYTEKTAKTTLKFDSKYKGVEIFQDGESKISLLDNGKIDLNIKPGEGIFVIPLLAK